MKRIRTVYVSVAAAAALWACGGGEPGDDEARDLSLVPAESTTVLDDQPQQAPEPEPQQPQASRPRPQTPRPAQPPPPPPAPREEPAPLTVPEGTTVELAATDTITSDDHQVGDRLTATTLSAVRDAQGQTVIPAGAVFTGTITEMDADEPRLVLMFNRVSFGGSTYALEARTDSVAAERRTDSFKAGDAAKIGAGAVVGAVAGRLIGKNTKGAVIGGAAGAAAGTGVALATRGDDLVLPAGALIRIVLTAPMVLQPVGA
jgi:hypothetical protein